MLQDLFPALRRSMPEQRRRGDLFSLMDELWQHSLSEPGASLRYPSVDVSETDKEVLVKAELPGIEKQDIDLSIENNVLSIKGEKKLEKEDKGESYHIVERSYGSFFRSVPLPVQCRSENVRATFDKGVLTVRIPKDEVALTREITIDS